MPTNVRKRTGNSILSSAHIVMRFKREWVNKIGSHESSEFFSLFFRLLIFGQGKCIKISLTEAHSNPQIWENSESSPLDLIMRLNGCDSIVQLCKNIRDYSRAKPRAKMGDTWKSVNRIYGDIRYRFHWFSIDCIYLAQMPYLTVPFLRSICSVPFHSFDICFDKL